MNRPPSPPMSEMSFADNSQIRVVKEETVPSLSKSGLTTTPTSSYAQAAADDWDGTKIDTKVSEEETSLFVQEHEDSIPGTPTTHHEKSYLERKHDVREDPEQDEDALNFASNILKDVDTVSELALGHTKASSETTHPDIKAVNRTAKRSFAGEDACSLSEDGKTWRLKGLKSLLKPYQLMGVGMMRDVETGKAKPKSGILADEMGLGKTVQMLANIVNGLQANKTKQIATLIVVPPALLEQWAREIDVHCKDDDDGIRHFMIYRSGNDKYYQGSGRMGSSIENSDIVLTTYHEVSKSYPDGMDKVKENEKNKDRRWEKRGVLHWTAFHRVVLDEATEIKNHKSKTSLACSALEARHYWCVTATPMQNWAREMYAFFRQIRHPVCGKFDKFQQPPPDSFKDFCHALIQHSEEEGLAQLARTVKRIAIRRTHADLYANARLLDLPKTTVINIFVDLTPPERVVFNVFERRYKTNLENPPVDGKRLCRWLVHIRLRQMCNNPLLGFQADSDTLEREDWDQMAFAVACKQPATAGSAFIAKVREIVKGHEEAENDTQKPAKQKVGGAHGKTDGMNGLLKAVRKHQAWTDAKNKAECEHCGQLTQAPVITSCTHIFCEACLETIEEELDEQELPRTCCTCDTVYTSVTPCSEGMDSIEPIRTKTPTKAGGTTIDFLALKGQVLPSAKTMAMKASILECIVEDPSVKIIVYTQWIAMIGIIEKVCKTEKWPTQTFHGEMSEDVRQKNLAEFKRNPWVRVLIVSLGTGSVGLNITEASCVIIMDQWWNMARELQAHARAYRYGQTKPTKLIRIIVRDAADMRMFELKQRKQYNVDQVMGETGDMEEKDSKCVSAADLGYVIGLGSRKAVERVKSENRAKRVKVEQFQAEEVKVEEMQVDGLKVETIKVEGTEWLV